MANKIQKVDTGKKTIRDYVKAQERGIRAALPSGMTPDRFTRIVLTALSTTPQLNNCTPKSFLGAMMTAAQLGLEPNTPLGQAYLIPYRNKGTLEAQFQLGYKGLIDLAYRSGEVELVQAQCVYENDTFNCQFGLEPKLEHIPADKDRGELVKVYALFKTKSGGFGFEVMSVDDVEKHAKKYSKAYSSSFSPWKTNFEEMAKKTVLKKCLKYAPLKSDFARGITTDETIKTDIDKDMYSVPDETDYDEPIIEAEAVEVNTETGEALSVDALADN